MSAIKTTNDVFTAAYRRVIQLEHDAVNGSEICTDARIKSARKVRNMLQAMIGIEMALKFSATVDERATKVFLAEQNEWRERLVELKAVLLVFVETGRV